MSNSIANVIHKDQAKRVQGTGPGKCIKSWCCWCCCCRCPYLSIDFWRMQTFCKGFCFLAPVKMCWQCLSLFGVLLFLWGTESGAQRNGSYLAIATATATAVPAPATGTLQNVWLPLGLGWKLKAPKQLVRFASTRIWISYWTERETGRQSARKKRLICKHLTVCMVSRLWFCALRLPLGPVYMHWPKPKGNSIWNQQQSTGQLRYVSSGMFGQRSRGAKVLACLNMRGTRTQVLQRQPPRGVAPQVATFRVFGHDL